MDWTGDPAAIAVLNALGNSSYVVKAVVRRGDGVAAVAVEESAQSMVVICERHGEVWDVPSMLGSSEGTLCGDPSARLDTTEALEPFVNLSVGQTGASQRGSDAPLVGWMYVSGVAARDAASVHVATEVDSHLAAVEEDGFFLAVVQAPWRSSPSVHVIDREGARTPVHL